MKRALAVVIFTSICFAVYAQEDPIKFGAIPMEDLKMVTYERDTSAVAVILADYGDARIFQDKIIFEHHKRIKILKAEGTSYADVSIFLYHNSGGDEKISGLKAVTYNLEDGKIVESKMDNGSVFQEKFNKSYNIKKFTLPNVKVGSVIEFTYKHVSDFIANFPNWQFQYKIPSRYTEYRAYIPDFLVMERYMTGYLGTQYDVKNFFQGSYTDKRHRWVIENVPAFKPEPYMTSETDYISKINFALAYVKSTGGSTREIMGSWQKLVDQLVKSASFGKGIKSNELKEKTDELLTGVTDPQQKLQIIYDYVKNTLTWNKTSDVWGNYFKETFAAKGGTSGDIHLVLASMLDKAGFTVEPILLSTREHGFIRKDIPMERQLNYVICSVKMNDKRIFLDATEKFLPLGIMPERCLNGEGLLVNLSANTFSWINLEAITKSKTTVSTDLVLNAEGELSGKVNFTRDGYDAHKSRSEFADSQEEYVKNISRGKSWEVAKSDFLTMDKTNVPAKESHEVVISDHATISGDIIYINPMLGFNIAENPFKVETRTYPVDFGSPFEKVVLTKITIPEGYVLDEVPQNKLLALPGGYGKYLYNINVLGNTINLTSSLSINKALFVQEEYPILREFYTQFVAKQSEQIVLKKK